MKLPQKVGVEMNGAYTGFILTSSYFGDLISPLGNHKVSPVGWIPSVWKHWHRRYI